jgi:hypothetical protein
MIDLEPRWVDVTQLLTVGPGTVLEPFRYEPRLLLDGIQFERLIDFFCLGCSEVLFGCWLALSLFLV